MEILIVIWIVLIACLNIVKKKNAGEKSQNSRYGSSGRKQESWRNTAEVTRSDITFRGLREGEDELAFLIRRNTAYEKLLQARLVSRGE